MTLSFTQGDRAKFDYGEKIAHSFLVLKKNRGLEFLAAFLSAMMSMLECLKLRNQRPERMAYKKTGHAYFQKEITFYCIQKSEGKCDQKRKSFSCDLAAVVVALIMKALETIVEALTFLFFVPSIDLISFTSEEMGTPKN